jgi:hypothetical protein
MVTGRQKLAGSTDKTINLGTDYTFQRGLLRGVLAGIGIHYRGRTVVGYRGSDTIVNPANPLTAIDDPTVDAYTSVYSKPYATVEASFGYLLKLHEKRSIKFSLNVTNLFNRRTPIDFLDVPGGQTTNTVLRPRNGDVTSPAVETVPAGYFYRTPIGFTLTAVVNF